jgi:hypothetical protein
MPKKILFSGQWKGEFVYGPEYGKLHGDKVNFMLFLEGDGEEFTGKGFDIEGTGAQSEVASIKGFCSDGLISFIKQYPLRYQIEEDGTLILEDGKPAPEIHYTGEYNETREMFSGKWEIKSHEEVFDDGFFEYLCTGTWEMRKERD